MKDDLNKNNDNEIKNLDDSISRELNKKRDEHNKELIGYSTKINDPAFLQCVKNTPTWAFQLSLILALIALFGFYFYGENSSQMDNPQALYIGFGTGCLFILIALITIFIKRRKTRTWDGEVVDKCAEKKIKEKHDADSDCQEYMLYTVCVMDETGKHHKTTTIDDATVFNYYEIGDKVRRHSGLNTYEKYDKSNDDVIFCNACASLNDIKDDYCSQCNCPF